MIYKDTNRVANKMAITIQYIQININVQMYYHKITAYKYI